MLEFVVMPWRKWVFKRKMKSAFESWDGISMDKAEEDFRRNVQDYVFNLVVKGREIYGDFSKEAQAISFSLLTLDEMTQMKSNSLKKTGKVESVRNVVNRDKRWKYSPEKFVEWYEAAKRTESTYFKRGGKGVEDAARQLDLMRYAVESSRIYVAYSFNSQTS